VLEHKKNAALVQEIRERIQIEQELQAANEQLQAEIREREALIADLDAFARMVAHDLKTPLQNLSLLSYLLRRELAAYPNPKAALELVEQIQQTGMKAGSIINELLTLASLRSTDIEYAPVDMNSVVKEAINRLRLMIDERSAEILSVNEIPQARGHAPWLVEVMVNLISNAISYGGEPPRIEIGADPMPNGFVRFWVKDNGDGILPQDREKLFHDFTRLATTRTSGHGLGLSITRRIITKLSGTVGVESNGRPGEGAVFWFSLPGVQAVSGE
jgi:signal transduction histidine kinase